MDCMASIVRKYSLKPETSPHAFEKTCKDLGVESLAHLVNTSGVIFFGGVGSGAGWGLESAETKIIVLFAPCISHGEYCKMPSP